MDINEMLNIDLIDVNLRAETKEELFELVGKDLEVKGFVNKKIGDELLFVSIKFLEI